jgi:hypothetical protein
VTDTNPIEDLRRAVREIRAACGTTPPNMVLVSPAIPPALDAHADRAERRERTQTNSHLLFVRTLQMFCELH